jgi:hypothetical protein
MPKKQIPNDKTRSLSTRTRLLPCKLTEPELLNYGQLMAQATQDIENEEGRQTSLKQELKARMTQLQATQSLLATKIARREETREVKVEAFLDLEKEEIYEVRQDTAEEISRRPVTDEERQETMFS